MNRYMAQSHAIPRTTDETPQERALREHVAIPQARKESGTVAGTMEVVRDARGVAGYIWYIQPPQRAPFNNRTAKYWPAPELRYQLAGNAKTMKPDERKPAQIRRDILANPNRWQK